MAGQGVPAHFGRYRIDGLVSRGGMGVVYRATDTGLERTVALKVIAPEVAADPGFRERFVHESRLAAALDHPNVISVYEAGEHDGTLFLAMRFVDGMDLREAIALAGALEPGRAATPCSPTSASSSPCSTPRATASRRPPPRAPATVSGTYDVTDAAGIESRGTITFTIARDGGSPRLTRLVTTS